MEKQPFDFEFDLSPNESGMTTETDNTDDLLFDDREESEETSSESIEESFLSIWRNESVAPICRTIPTGEKTEVICEEVIETVITKHKRYYIRSGFQANKNKNLFL